MLSCMSIPVFAGKEVVTWLIRCTTLFLLASALLGVTHLFSSLKHWSMLMVHSYSRVASPGRLGM